MKRGSKSLIFIALFWSSITLVFDSLIVMGFWDEYRARDFLQATGTITHSDMDEGRDSDGKKTYTPNIHYTYYVNDQRFESTKYGFQSWSTSNDDHSRKIVQQHPLHSNTTVYYNPQNPQEAVLQPVGGMHYFLFVFMMPFNFIMVGLWYGGIASFFPNKPASDFYAQEVSGRSLVRLSTFSPLAAAGGAVFLASFGSIFVIGILTGLSLGPTGLINWGIIMLTVGVCAYLWHQYRLNSGACDLVIDRAAQFVNVPAIKNRSVHRIPLTAITEVNLTTRDDHGTTYFSPTIYWVDETGARQETRLLEISNDRDKAENLQRWLHLRLNPKAKP